MLAAAQDQRARLRGILDHYADQYGGLPPDAVRLREHEVWSGVVMVFEAMAKAPDESRAFVQRMMARKS